MTQSDHADNVAAAFDACADKPGHAPMLTDTQARTTLKAAEILAVSARTQDELRFPRFLLRVLDNTAACPVSIDPLAALLRKRTEDLTLPPPEPRFRTWLIQYQGLPQGGWTTVSEYNTHTEAAQDLPTHKRSPGNYRIVGITE